MFKLFATKTISAKYEIIKNPNQTKLRRQFSHVWQDKSLPDKQWELTQKQLPKFENIAPMAAAVQILKKVPLKNPRLLEIGCSTGYYNQVFKEAGIPVRYEGCDYSKDFISKAKIIYPNIKFKICDATKLAYKNGEFDIVFSAGCLLHIIAYEKAIQEAARVSKNFVIFHRTPIVHEVDTLFTQKIGYDLPMLEIIFNERELTDLFFQNNLKILTINTHSQFPITDLPEPVFMKTYLCQKNK